MNLNLAERKTKLTSDIQMCERRIQELTSMLESEKTKLNEARGGLAILNELEAQLAAAFPKRATDNILQIPAIKLSDAVGKATVALRKFTRQDLEQWIRSNYPHLQFSKKSVDGPIRDLMASGEVVVLRRNTGNKIPAVYGLKDTPQEQG